MAASAADSTCSAGWIAARESRSVPTLPDTPQQLEAIGRPSRRLLPTGHSPHSRPAEWGLPDKCRGLKNTADAQQLLSQSSTLGRVLTFLCCLFLSQLLVWGLKVVLISWPGREKSALSMPFTHMENTAGRFTAGDEIRQKLLVPSKRCVDKSIALTS